MDVGKKHSALHVQSGKGRPRDMATYDEYQIVINGAQRRLIMRALTNAMANDRRSTAGGALTRPTEDEWMQLYSAVQHDQTVYAKTAALTSHCCCCLAQMNKSLALTNKSLDPDQSD